MRKSNLNNKTIVLGIGLLLCLLQFAGCRNIKWTTFDYYNYSDNEIRVYLIGARYDASPGVLVPTATKSSEFADPVHFDETIKIEWTIGDDDTKHEKEFRRDDLGIPEVVKGGVITFIYTKAGEWEINYSKHQAP